MKVLALEPYYGGSHQAMLDGWIASSTHHWTLLRLPAYKWKWRMRHAAITFAERLRSEYEGQGPWDVLFTTDMLNLAEFRGLAPREVSRLPTVVYFHENQLTYPNQQFEERDLHFAFTNLTTALCADQVWFNSAFHRDIFLGALREYLPRMPDHQPISAIDQIAQKSSVHFPGIAPMPSRPMCNRETMHILWAARWEHDKNPDDFFAAIKQLELSGVDFRLNIIGEHFKNYPPIFDEARQSMGHLIHRWGFQPSRDEYIKTLHESDVFVSTAKHEFFGISAVEAIAAGVRPLLPERLSYPEILELKSNPSRRAFFYDGTVRSLVDQLSQLVGDFQDKERWREESEYLVEAIRRYEWSKLARIMDDALEGTR